MTHDPAPLDFASLVPDAHPRRFLVLPPGFQARAEPDAVSPVFAMAPQALMAALDSIALGEPRTQRRRQDGGQAEYVQRSKVFRFADLITLQAFAHEGGSALAAYSRAQVGYYDFKVNQRRLERWIAAARQADGKAK
ncbi:DUF1499 domain-containing protein [Alkalicaulis satelles]|nr:DUF1499 domain-containing protein [Alkalicaulis satelles]